MCRYDLPSSLGPQPDSTKRSAPAPSFPRAPCPRDPTADAAAATDQPERRPRAETPGPAAYAGAAPESCGAQAQSDRPTAPSYSFGLSLVRFFMGGSRTGG